MPADRYPRTRELEKFIVEDPNAENKELYEAFPEIPKSFIRRKKADYLHRQDPTNISVYDEVSSKKKKVLADFSTDSLKAELLRLYNVSSDEERKLMMKNSVLELWKSEHKVPTVQNAEDHALGDILLELQKSRKPVETSVPAESHSN